MFNSLALADTVNDAFEVVEKFQDIVAFHYEIARVTSTDVNDCAIRCLTSCEVTDLECDYFIHTPSNECIFGNIVDTTTTSVPAVTPVQYLGEYAPLLALSYRKDKVADIAGLIPATYTANTCPKRVDIADPFAAVTVDEGATACEYAIYNDLGGKVKITLGGSWAQV